MVCEILNIVVHFHGKGIRKYTKRSNFWLLVYKAVLKKVHIIHLSPILFKDIEDVRDKKYQLIAIPNGIDLPRENFLIEKNRIFTFIYLSNLVPDKGADLLINASILIPDELQSKYQIKIFGGSHDEKYKEDF